MADHTAAENEKTPDKEAHEENASHEVLTPETPLGKIIPLVFATMTIDVNAPYAVSRSTLQTPATRKQEDASARRDMRSLCMVSNWMASEARPALYRNILVVHADTLVLLYRTFLENPQLGKLVKRMSLDLFLFADASVSSFVVLGGLAPMIDIEPLLSHAQHGFADHLPVDSVLGWAAYNDEWDAYNKIALERLYTLQLRVLGRTSELESLDWNLHPRSEGNNKHDKRTHMNSNSFCMAVVDRVLRSLWSETAPSLLRLKELQLIGKEKNCAFWGRRVRFAALICRCFLTLPRLQQIVWFNHAHGWFDAFADQWTGSLHDDAKSIRTIKLKESPCLPHDLANICSLFPHLESLSVDTESNQCRERLRRIGHNPQQLHERGFSNSGLVIKYLTDSLATLEHLTTLNLDLHYVCNVSPSLGPSGILSLVDLPNLQTLGVPFHFFVRKGLDGHHKAVSPASVLPYALKSLRIVACFWCIGYRFYKCPKIIECSCGAYRIRGYASDRAACAYRHPDAVLEFLEGIANVRAEHFPNLVKIQYEEGKPDPITHRHMTWKCPHPPTEILMHSNRDTPDALRLAAASESLRQSGVVFNMCATQFGCRRYPMFKYNL